MRDGVKLYGDLYRPARAVSYPVLWFGLLMGFSATVLINGDQVRAARVRSVTCRTSRAIRVRRANGTRFETKPMTDTTPIEWAAKQPWSNGEVALQGGSYLGHVQWRAATQSPPSLVACFRPLLRRTFTKTG